MRYSVTFKDLPFEPELRQVIYVENQYDERINAIIRDNYERLKWNFKRSNLDFIYLPMFFNDEEIKEKVLYYAPYLTSEIMEKIELRSSYLLGFMSHVENKDKIAPSLLFAPKNENEEWIFQGQTIDFDTDDTNEIIHWFEDIIFDIDEDLTPAEQSREIRYDEDLEGFGRPIMAEEAQEEPQVEYSSTPNIWDKLKKECLKFGKKIVLEESDEATGSAPSRSSLDEIQEEDVKITLEELERNIERLRLLGLPMDVIIEFVVRYETISRLCITEDLQIFLPEYNNKEVKMGALFKAVYFLFLNHPEGIVLQRLEDYHHELVNYYLQTSKKKELSSRMIETINTIEYPGNNSINIVLSKIKAEFKKVVDDHLARHYYITGSPGEPYKISLDKDLIVWEDEK